MNKNSADRYILMRQGQIEKQAKRKISQKDVYVYEKKKER